MRRLILLACLLLLATAAPASAAGVDGERSVEVVDVLFGARTTVARVPGTDGTLSVAAFPGGELSVLDTTTAASTLSVLSPAGGAALARFAWPQLGPDAEADPLPGGERFLTWLPGWQPLLVNRDGSAPVALGLTTVMSTAIAPDGRVAIVYAVPGPAPADGTTMGWIPQRWPPGTSSPAPGDTFRLRVVDPAGAPLADVPTTAFGLVRWGPEGLVASTLPTGAIVLLDPASGTAVRALPDAWGGLANAISPDGTRIAGIGFDDDGTPTSVVLRDGATGALLDAFQLPDGRQSKGTISVAPPRLTWSPDGTRLALTYVRTRGRLRTTGVDLLTLNADHLSWRPLASPTPGWRGGARWSGDATHLALRSVVPSRQLPRVPPTCRRADFGLGSSAPPWALSPTRLRGDVRCVSARRVALRYLGLGGRAVPAWRCRALPGAQVRCTSHSKSFTFTVV